MKAPKISKIYIPANIAEDWRPLLADPVKHWKTGYSAKSLASCWQAANDFPKSVRNVFDKSNLILFKDIELLIAFPEYGVALPGGLQASQNDIFVLAKGSDQLITIAVEGKVREPFGLPVNEWRLKKDDKTNKKERLDFLLDQLNIADKPVDHIRYQLFHRTVSALLEAKKFCTKNALMLVHSFSQTYEHYDDYKEFLALFNLSAEKDKLIGPVNIRGINLYFAWVKGEEKYLSI